MATEQVLSSLSSTTLSLGLRLPVNSSQDDEKKKPSTTSGEIRNYATNTGEFVQNDENNVSVSSVNTSTTITTVAGTTVPDSFQSSVPEIVIDLQKLVGYRPSSQDVFDTIQSQFVQAMWTQYHNNSEPSDHYDQQHLEQEEKVASTSSFPPRMVPPDFDRQIQELFQAKMARFKIPDDSNGADNSSTSCSSRSCLSDSSQSRNSRVEKEKEYASSFQFLILPYPPKIMVPNDNTNNASTATPAIHWLDTSQAWKDICNLVHFPLPVSQTKNKKETEQNSNDEDDNETYILFLDKLTRHLVATSRSLSWKYDMARELRWCLQQALLEKQHHDWIQQQRQFKLDHLYTVRETMVYQTSLAQQNVDRLCRLRQNKMSQEWIQYYHHQQQQKTQLQLEQKRKTRQSEDDDNNNKPTDNHNGNHTVASSNSDEDKFMKDGSGWSDFDFGSHEFQGLGMMLPLSSLLFPNPQQQQVEEEEEDLRQDEDCWDSASSSSPSLIDDYSDDDDLEDSEEENDDDDGTGSAYYKQMGKDFHEDGNVGIDVVVDTSVDDMCCSHEKEEDLLQHDEKNMVVPFVGDIGCDSQRTLPNPIATSCSRFEERRKRANRKQQQRRRKEQRRRQQQQLEMEQRQAQKQQASQMAMVKEELRSKHTTNELVLAQTKLQAFQQKLQNVDELLESLQDEVWAAQEAQEEDEIGSDVENNIENDGDDGEDGKGAKYHRHHGHHYHQASDKASRGEVQSSFSLLDQVLAMILGALPMEQDETIEQHHCYIRREHDAIIQGWKEYFGRLPPPAISANPFLSSKEDDCDAGGGNGNEGTTLGTATASLRP